MFICVLVTQLYVTSWSHVTMCTQYIFM